jgi:hypothetical protein
MLSHHPCTAVNHAMKSAVPADTKLLHISKANAVPQQYFLA